MGLFWQICSVVVAMFQTSDSSPFMNHPSALALVGRQVVHIDFQNQAGHRRRIYLVWAGPLVFGTTGRHVPASIRVLMFQQKFTDSWVPGVPRVSAELEEPLNRVVMQVIEVLGSLPLKWLLCKVIDRFLD